MPGAGLFVATPACSVAEAKSRDRCGQCRLLLLLPRHGGSRDQEPMVLTHTRAPLAEGLASSA